MPDVAADAKAAEQRQPAEVLVQQPGAAAARMSTPCMIFSEVLQALVHTGSYVFYVLVYKLSTQDPHAVENENAPGAGVTAPTTTTTNTFLDWRLNFQAPLFLNVCVATHVFLVTSLYLLFGNAYNFTITPGHKSYAMFKQQKNSFLGLPVSLLVANVMLNVLSGFSYLSCLLYLPVSVVEPVMMVGPAVSIVVTSVLQPNVQYNRWTWASVLPIVLGGMFAAGAGSGLSDFQSDNAIAPGGGAAPAATTSAPTATSTPAGAEAMVAGRKSTSTTAAVLGVDTTNVEQQSSFLHLLLAAATGTTASMLPSTSSERSAGALAAARFPIAGPSASFSLGIIWSIVAVLSRAFRIIIVDLVQGNYEKNLTEKQLQRATEGQQEENEISPLLVKKQSSKTGTIPRNSTLDSIGEDEVAAENPQQPPAAKVELTAADAQSIKMPSAVRTLQLILPFNWCCYLFLSFLMEHEDGVGSAWLPYNRVQQLLAEDSALKQQYPNMNFPNFLRAIFCIGIGSALWLLTEFLLIDACGSYTCSIFANLNRMCSAIFAVLLLHEPVTKLQLFGAGLLVFGMGMKFTLGDAVNVATAATPAADEEQAGRLPVPPPLSRLHSAELSREDISRQLSLRRDISALGDVGADAVLPIPQALDVVERLTSERALDRQRSLSRNLSLQRSASRSSGSSPAVPRQYSAVRLDA
ncbi:unnamed protein product [Amoebophrya sp. A120]|nr:unnamed protein product [Amoebophrya sp. A120]|eukprot:GSA120T00022923001.1